MIRDRIILENIKDISELSVEFVFPDSNIIVVTGKNGAGKTSLVKAYYLLKDPQIFTKLSGLNAVRTDSRVSYNLDGFEPFEFAFSAKVGDLDSTDTIPAPEKVVAELPVPFGERFNQFSLIAKHDSEIRTNIASSQYERADGLIDFLSKIYATNKFENLQVTKVKKYKFYFLLREDDYYIREDHFSSGEYFIIQLFRLVTSGAKLILIDEMDVALDAAAQIRIYHALKSLVLQFNARLILISHSLGFMSTVDDGGLYYLEEIGGKISLEMRSYGYIKSDLYGFSGYERYILTEDKILEEFINFLIKRYSVIGYYQYATIGVGGVNQLQLLVEKNDQTPIFSSPENIICIVDGDSFLSLSGSYEGSTRIFSSPVPDIERYVYTRRQEFFQRLDRLHI